MSGSSLQAAGDTPLQGQQVGRGGRLLRGDAGTYTVQPDCTLDFTVQVLSRTPGLVLTFSAVMVQNGAKMLVIQRDPGALFVGTLEG